MNIRKKRLIAALAVVMTPLMATTPVWAMGEAKPNKFWWPEQVDLSPLRDQGIESNPYGADFDYAAEFATLDLDAVSAPFSIGRCSRIQPCRAPCRW